MDDDTGFLIFMAIGVLILVLIVVFGVASSRRKAKTNAPSWTTRVASLGAQPYLESSDVDQPDARQWELFQKINAPGTTLDVPVLDDAGEDRVATLTVARVQRSLRAGWPQAKIGFTAYFREFEQSEFPLTLVVSGEQRITAVQLDAAGVTALTADQTVVWRSAWADLSYSNGTDLILHNGRQPIHIATSDADQDPLEELVIKYGRLKQMHF
ncbi:hypothetical protein [Plantibacter sp. YIM 135347]|uniref:hypothetical protein n=1 Tax=Plantibacter sp. YIM 135347 TaxID=3423919 RepID=UPI003D325973